MTKPEKTARKKRADARYTMAVKLTKSRGGGRKADKPESVDDESAVAASDADHQAEGMDDAVVNEEPQADAAPETDASDD